MASHRKINELMQTVRLQEIKHPLVSEQNLKLFILRLDELNPEMSGNKLFKLHYNIAEMKKQGKSTLLSFGGTFSNHIAATAAAGKIHNINTIGIIRGDEVINHTLETAKENGMKLDFVSRDDYRRKGSDDFIKMLHDKWGDFYLVPEGGANELGVKGCEEIMQHITINFNYVCCAVGTGTTLAGVANSLQTNQKAIGFMALKGADNITNEIRKYNTNNRFSIVSDYHFGGYAKINKQLSDFVDTFYKEHNIMLDYVYTAKMMYGIFDLIAKKRFGANSTLVAIHTGGLQGNKGFIH
jgi:1-aminocyclopropane-1-carboxylate deaminase